MKIVKVDYGHRVAEVGPLPDDTAEPLASQLGASMHGEGVTSIRIEDDRPADIARAVQSAEPPSLDERVAALEAACARLIRQVSHLFVGGLRAEETA